MADGIVNLNKLKWLVLDFGENSIKNDGGKVIGNNLINLKNLVKLSLNLEDNYIDNVRFEIILENVE